MTAVPNAAPLPSTVSRDKQFVLGFLIFALGLSLVVQTFRLLRLTSGAEAILFYFVLTSTTFVLFWLVVRLRAFKPLTIFDGLFALLAGVGVLGIASHGATIEDVVGNSLRLVQSWAAVRIGLTLAKDELRDFFRKFAKVGLYGTIISLFLLYTLGVFGPLSVYLGMNSEHLTVALASLPAKGVSHPVVVVLMSLLSGKRGPLLAVFVVAVLAAVVLRGRGRTVMALGIGAVFGVFLLFQTVDVESYVQTWPAPIAGRILPIIDQNPNTDPFSGRFIEVEKVLRAWRLGQADYIMGQGLGGNLSNLGRSDSTIHISPLWMVFIFGLPLTVVFLGWLAYFCLSSLFRPTFTERSAALVAIGYFVTSLSIMIIFQAPIAWICVGYLLGRRYGLPASNES
jgi:hypothetical protein